MADLKEITDTLVTRILAGDIRKAGALWKTSGGGRLPRNFHSGRHYSGINLLVLWLEAMDRGYSSPCWLTLKQCNSLGGTIRKGEKGTPVVVWSPRERKKVDDTGKEVVQRVLFHRIFSVFNLQQTSLYEDEPVPDIPRHDAVAYLEERVSALGVQYKIQGESAYYSITSDTLVMPMRHLFSSQDNYAAVLAHELVHSTGHSSRLNRDMTGDRSTESYAFEELVAELGAAFLCTELQIDGTYDAHASYLNSWAKLFNDKAAIITSAASKASKAFEYIGDQTDERFADVGEGSEAGAVDCGLPGSASVGFCQH
jgi:antirestriction protein ArdC